MKRENEKLAAAAVIVIAAAVARFIPHPPNFTPIGAMALFAGAQIGSPLAAVAVLLSSMLLSDMVIGFHPLMPVVYGALVLTVFIGRGASGRFSSIFSRCLLSSTLFFVLTNFAEWAFGTMYPKTTAGLAACFTAAIPFFNSTLAGDLFYTALLFGALAIVKRGFLERRAEMPAAF